MYNNLLNNFNGITLLKENYDYDHSYWLYGMRVEKRLILLLI